MTVHIDFNFHRYELLPPFPDTPAASFATLWGPTNSGPVKIVVKNTGECEIGLTSGPTNIESTYPLAPGETFSFDVPAGDVIDNELQVCGSLNGEGIGKAAVSWIYSNSV